MLCPYTAWSGCSKLSDGSLDSCSLIRSGTSSAGMARRATQWVAPTCRDRSHDATFPFMVRQAHHERDSTLEVKSTLPPPRSRPGTGLRKEETYTPHPSVSPRTGFYLSRKGREDLARHAVPPTGRARGFSGDSDRPRWEIPLLEARCCQTR